MDRHTADAEQFAEAMAKVAASPELVRLGADGRRQDRFTTREMLATEQRMERAAGELAERQAHRVELRRRQALMELTTLGREQGLAFRHVTKARDLSVVVGYAGTGKSTMLAIAREAWEADGYQVRGAALSGIAAEQLEAGSGITSRTVHSLLFQWDQGREELAARDVMVVDEAGMIGSRQMERLLSYARAAGAKVVLVGDPEQLQAIEAGAAFRAIAERVGSAEITEVRRQREDWQQQATHELATGLTAGADGARGTRVCCGRPGVFSAERARVGREERHARHGGADRGSHAGPGRSVDGAAGRWALGRLRHEGLRACRPRLRGDGAQEPRGDGGPGACAGHQPSGVGGLPSLGEGDQPRRRAQRGGSGGLSSGRGVAWWNTISIL